MTGPAHAPRLQSAVHVHDESCGHDHLSSGARLSMGVWSGLALALVATLVAGLIVGARIARRRAARRIPCPSCGTYFDPAMGAPCPSCGRAPDGKASGGQ